MWITAELFKCVVLYLLTVVRWHSSPLLLYLLVMMMMTLMMTCGEQRAAETGHGSNVEDSE